jgi:hypothetical protein
MSAPVYLRKLEEIFEQNALIEKCASIISVGPDFVEPDPGMPEFIEIIDGKHKVFVHRSGYT